MSKNPQVYYSSDWHFSHKNILKFERGEKFKTIEEHDQFLIKMITDWSKKWAEGSTLWFLGDFGNPDFLWVFDILRAKNITVYFLMGNHDKLSLVPEIEKHVDQVFLYPVYTSQKLVLSHYPVAVYDDSINICGHLHSAKLADKNHMIASIHVANYQAISQRQVDSVFASIPKFDRRFLYEPYAKDYVFLDDRDDCIYDRSGRIDLPASRIYSRLKKEQKND